MARRYVYWLKRLVVALLLSLALLFLREVVLLLTRRLYGGVEGHPLHFLSPTVLRKAFSPLILFNSLGAVFLFALLRGYASCAIVALGEYIGTVKWLRGTVYPKDVPAHRVGDEHVLLSLPTPISVYSFYVMTGIAIAVVIYAIVLIRRIARKENRESKEE